MIDFFFTRQQDHHNKCFHQFSTVFTGRKRSRLKGQGLWSLRWKQFLPQYGCFQTVTPVLILRWLLSQAWVWKPMDLGRGQLAVVSNGKDTTGPNLHICSSGSVHVHGIHAISGDYFCYCCKPWIVCSVYIFIFITLFFPDWITLFIASNSLDK